MKLCSFLVFCMFLLGVNVHAQEPAKHIFTKSDASSSEDFQSMTFNGAWCWFSDPRAVYFEGKHKRTYAGWIDNYGDIHIGYYDHTTKQIASTIIYDNLEIDDHDNPTILFDKQGRLLVFFNTHLQDERPLLMRISTNPEDIENWEPLQELYLNNEDKYRKARILKHTYTNPVKLSQEEERIYIFWRGADLKPSYSVSDDNGETWSEGEILFVPEESEELKAPYTKVYSDGVSKIHFTFTNGHPTKEAKNGLYYMYYENGAFYKANGQKIKEVSQLPVYQSEVDVIFESDTVKSWNWDIAQDAKGNPIVTYAKFPDKKTHVYSYATFHKNQWQSYDLIDAGGWFPKTRKGTKEPEPHYAGGIVIDHETPNTVYLSVKRDSVFEIEQWTTKNYGKSWKVQKITENSTKDNVRPFAVRGAKKDNPLQVLWLQNTNYIYYAYDTRGKEIPIDFKDRYQTAVKMHLKKPTVSSEVTKANLIHVLRQIAEQLLENPDHSVQQQDWQYGMRFAGIEAFYQISEEARYQNELINIQQYQTEAQEDVDEDELDLIDLIWSYTTKDDPNGQQRLESLAIEDFEIQEASLTAASLIRTIDVFTDEILTIDALKATCKKHEERLFINLLNAHYIGKTEQVDALMIYSIAKGMQMGIFDTKYKQNVLDVWKHLQLELVKGQNLQKLDVATSAAILLAGTEIYTLLD
ncbi:MAG: BNR-4 repeat-containing protein [Bacteroidota bacterium]